MRISLSYEQNLRKFILTTEFKTIKKLITREMIFSTKLHENFVQCEETTGTHEGKKDLTDSSKNSEYRKCNSLLYHGGGSVQ